MSNNNHKYLAKKIREHALHMTHDAKTSHIGTCLSMADLLAVIYNKVLRFDPSKPDWEERDRFILSKGHGAAIYYAILAECGFFPKDWLNTYCQDGSKLGGHITKNEIPGIEVSTGSLGHGMPIGCGMALAGKTDNQDYRVFVMLSDGELDEGSNWEAILFAAQHRLDNLIGIVDYNKIQGFGNVNKVLNLEPLLDKFSSFGWLVKEIDGHDLDQISISLEHIPFEKGKPSIIIAHTVKGKGVSFMENKLLWHYKSPNDDELMLALSELGEPEETV
jgi:transketolase